MKNTLQTKLIILIVVFAFASAVLVGTMNTYLLVTSTKAKFVESNRIIATQMASEIERFMVDATGLVEA